MAQSDQQLPTRSLAPTMAAMNDTEQLTWTELCWKRFVKVFQVIQIQAVAGAVLLGMESMRDRIAQEALAAYNRVSGNPPAQIAPSNQLETATPKDSAPSYTDPMFVPMTQGDPMSRSTMNKGVFKFCLLYTSPSPRD